MTSLLLRGEFGSRAYGTNTIDSDRDMVEIVVESKEFITGLYDFKTIAGSTSAPGERSTAVDTDTSTYGLQKFADLAVAGNPTLLGILYLGDYEVLTPMGKSLVNQRDLFVSRHAGFKFLGYMTSQRAAMTGERNKRTNRPELIHKYGYDTKFAYHMIRLGMLGIELMQTGTIQLPMRPGDVHTLMKIRSGEYDKDTVLNLSYELEALLTELAENADLPEFGDREKVSDILHGIYLTTWMNEDLASGY